MPSVLIMLAQCSNVHDRIRVLIFWQMISCETLLYSFSYHYRYSFFCIWNERNLIWNWYRWKIIFHSILEIFHSIVASSIFYNKISVRFYSFSIPFHTMPCFWPNVESGKFKLKKAFQSGKILACTTKSEICTISTLKLIKMMLKCQAAQASSTCMLY